MNKIFKILRKTEIYFILSLFALNVYCAFALRGEHFANPTYLMMASVMLMFVSDKLLKKLEKK